eukprot:766488-Rhodomonas_salina.2
MRCHIEVVRVWKWCWLDRKPLSGATVESRHDQARLSRRGILVKRPATAVASRRGQRGELASELTGSESDHLPVVRAWQISLSLGFELGSKNKVPSGPSHSQCRISSSSASFTEGKNHSGSCAGTAHMS